jgi:hypothetical protein
MYNSCCEDVSSPVGSIRIIIIIIIIGRRCVGWIHRAQIGISGGLL